MDPRAQPLQIGGTQFRGHLISPAPGMLGRSYHGSQEGPTMTVSFYYSKEQNEWSAMCLHEFINCD